MTLSKRELKEIMVLLDREVEEVKEGYQLGSAEQLRILEVLRNKIRGEYQNV